MLSIIKLECKPDDAMLLRGSNKIKNVDCMMVNYDIAAVREFMFCIWCQIIMVRLFLQLIKKKLTSFDKFPPLTTKH